MRDRDKKVGNREAREEGRRGEKKGRDGRDEEGSFLHYKILF